MRAPVVLVLPTTCARTLKPGQVKRVMWAGPLIGYFIACPACKYKASYLHSTCEFVEPLPEPGKPHPRALIGIKKPPKCFSCQRVLQVKDGFLEAS